MSSVARLTVGLTGGIAAGKSTVAELLAKRGAVIIDSDELARQVVAPGTLGLAAVRARFGADVIHADGSLDRAQLGQIVFADDDARADLNAIVHPLVRAESARLVGQAPEGTVVVQVIPLLLETGQASDFDAVVVVDVPQDVQLHRLMQRNGLSLAEGQARLRAQASRADRLAVADYVVDNSGSSIATQRQVDALWEQLQTKRFATGQRQSRQQ